ncbi:MAG TPA: glycosyltransferase [Rhodanobacteraceae bacterium]|nr:glycosyltransferase [Rhodanobacteraceae bacterium]
MHITHLVENLNRGGLERVVLDLIEAQVAAGHRCQVICLFERGQLAPELDALGVAVHACGKRGRPDPRVVMQVRRLVRGHGSQVLHTHNAVAHYHGALATIGLRRSVAIVNTRHGMQALAKGQRREWLYRRSLALTAAVVTVCERARIEFERQRIASRRQLLAIPNGIRVSRFRPANAEAHHALTRQLGLPPQTRLIGTIGRLNWAKDPLTLVEAYARLRRHCPDTALLLAGKGELRDQVQAAVDARGLGDSVRLLGDRNDIPELLAGLDMLMMSSLTEGYSVALLEACAAGLPIVATDVGGNGEIVRDGINGRLVPAGDPAALAAAAESLLQAPDTAQAMGAAGRAWVLEHGSLTTMATRYQELYQSCL